METDKLKNKEMNKNVYELRQNVMEFIYEIKEDFNIPRIEVRITENDENINGVGRMNENKIWITKETANGSELILRRTVYHEVLHATIGQEHVEGCPLMDKTGQKITETTAKTLFEKYYK